MPEANDLNHPGDPGGGIETIDQSEIIARSMAESVVSETGTVAGAADSYASVTMTSTWGLDGRKCRS